MRVRAKGLNWNTPAVKPWRHWSAAALQLTRKISSFCPRVVMRSPTALTYSVHSGGPASPFAIASDAEGSAITDTAEIAAVGAMETAFRGLCLITNGNHRRLSAACPPRTTSLHPPHIIPPNMAASRSPNHPVRAGGGDPRCDMHQHRCGFSRPGP